MLRLKIYGDAICAPLAAEFIRATKHSLDGAAEWIRKRSDALAVLVVRREDFSFAVHDLVAPHDASYMVESMLGQMATQLATERQAKRLEGKKKRELKGVFK